MENKMPSYKLTYYNLRSRGELIRLVFAAAGVEYEDFRIDVDDWPGDFKAATPFGQIPTLEVDGVLLCQSYTCARYLARKYNLAGKTELDQARADMIAACLEDTIKPMLKFYHEEDENRKAELRKKYVEGDLHSSLSYLENILKENNNGDKFFVGDELTWADLVFLNLMQWFPTRSIPEPLAKFPALTALQKRIEAVPNVAVWLANRPKTDH